MARAFASQVLSANRLADGRVVFLGPDRAGWVDDFHAAGVWRTQAEATAAIGAAQAFVAANVVLDVAPVEVTGEGDRLRPVSLRDAIRAALRPSVAPRLPSGFTLDTTFGGGI
jgi:hypothetical protein